MSVIRSQIFAESVKEVEMTVRKLITRRRCGIAAATLVALALVNVFTPHIPRRTAIWVLGVYYRHILTYEVSTPDLGPDPPAESRATAIDGLSLTLSGPSPQWEFPFVHEDLDSNEAQQFSRQINGHVAQAGGPFAWSQELRSMAPHGVSNLPPDVSRSTMLEHAVRGEPLTCYYFAHLFQATCVVHGYTTRVLGLSSDGTRFEHAVVEVYMPQHQKWVLVDCDFNVAYRSDEGEFLNAMELQQFWRKAKRHLPFDAKHRRRLPELLGVDLVVLGDAGERLRESNMLNVHSGMNLRLFEWILFDCRNNFLSASYPFGHPDAVRQLFLGPGNEAPDIAPEAKLGQSIDPYPHVGAVGVALRDRVTLQVGTLTPNFHHFEMRRGGDWSPLDDNMVVLDLTTRRLEFRTVNSAGIRGPIRGVEIRRRPD